MKLNKDSIAFFEEFAPKLEQKSLKWKMWVGFLSICVLFALYALFLQVRDGHIVTGMRDNVIWGIYIANFIFFIGISYAGAVISGTLHLLKVDWRRPIIRIAMSITVITAFVGPF